MNSKKEREGERERKIERVTEKDRELQSIYLDPLCEYKNPDLPNLSSVFYNSSGIPCTL